MDVVVSKCVPPSDDLAKKEGAVVTCDVTEALEQLVVELIDLSTWATDGKIVAMHYEASARAEEEARVHLGLSPRFDRSWAP